MTLVLAVSLAFAGSAAAQHAGCPEQVPASCEKAVATTQAPAAACAQASQRGACDRMVRTAAAPVAIAVPVRPAGACQETARLSGAVAPQGEGSCSSKATAAGNASCEAAAIAVAVPVQDPAGCSQPQAKTSATASACQTASTCQVATVAIATPVACAEAECEEGGKGEDCGGACCQAGAAQGKDCCVQKLAAKQTASAAAAHCDAVPSAQALTLNVQVEGCETGACGSTTKAKAQASDCQAGAILELATIATAVPAECAEAECEDGGKGKDCCAQKLAAKKATSQVATHCDAAPSGKELSLHFQIGDEIAQFQAQPSDCQAGAARGLAMIAAAVPAECSEAECEEDGKGEDCGGECCQAGAAQGKDCCVQKLAAKRAAERPAALWIRKGDSPAVTYQDVRVLELEGVQPGGGSFYVSQVGEGGECEDCDSGKVQRKVEVKVQGSGCPCCDTPAVARPRVPGPGRPVGIGAPLRLRIQGAGMAPRTGMMGFAPAGDGGCACPCPGCQVPPRQPQGGMRRMDGAMAPMHSLHQRIRAHILAACEEECEEACEDECEEECEDECEDECEEEAPRKSRGAALPSVMEFRAEPVSQRTGSDRMLQIEQQIHQLEAQLARIEALLDAIANG